MRVGVRVTAVDEGVTVTGEGVLAGAVGEGVTACPPQAVANPRTVNSAKAILQTLKVLKTFKLFLFTGGFLQKSSLF
jgi:hypothetical protein